MTRQHEPVPDDQATHHWLTQYQHTLTHALDDLLDVEAGLREILLHSHHDAAVDNLGTVLDAEAGLAAILPTPTPAPPSRTDAPDAEELLRTLSPAERIALRNHPDVKAASQALKRAIDLTRGLILDPARNRNFAHAHAVALELNLALAGDLAQAIERDLDYALTHADALDLNLGLVRASARAGGLAQAIERDLNRALDHARDLDHALDLALARVRVRADDLALAIERDHADALDHDLTRALARARDLASVIEHTRALDVDHARDRDLGGVINGTRDVIIEIRIAEVERAVGLALRREPAALDENALYRLLDDFTTGDLRDVDLAGVDLGGVHWSEHTTQWPPSVDVEDLKTRSDEIPSGTGIWIVRSGTATIRGFAEL
ncbi:hypothetical protein [Streptomyces sp. NPDC094149]|uniref:hypothetical protein n=1 Tax=Streptomyces sp. NPDC094149 TaxID=3155079 RepID=UPI00331B72C8